MARKCELRRRKQGSSKKLQVSESVWRLSNSPLCSGSCTPHLFASPIILHPIMLTFSTRGVCTGTAALILGAWRLFM